MSKTVVTCRFVERAPQEVSIDKQAGFSEEEVQFRHDMWREYFHEASAAGLTHAECVAYANLEVRS